MKLFKTLLILSAAAVLTAACRGENLDPDGNDYTFTTLRIDGTETRSDSLWFKNGTSGQLSIDQMAEASWSVKDSKVASISSSGLLTIKSCGKTEVTATKGSRTASYGLIVPEQTDECYDIKGATFKVSCIILSETESMYVTSTAIPAYVWNAVMSMEEHFYSYSFWAFTPSWEPAASQTTVATFVSELSRLTGVSFRLPTQEEWNRFAKATGRSSKAYTSDSSTGEETELWLIRQ